MFFSANFWIGSKENWDEQAREYLLEFWFTRFAVTLFIGIIFFLFGLLVDWVFRNIISFNRKRIIIELLIVLILSIVLVSIPIFY
jgi:hypothetical protein